MANETPDIDWGAAFKEHFEQFDHPLNPDLKVKDYGLAVELATASKFGGDSPQNAHASPHEAGLFWREFSAVNPPIAPQHYLETLGRLAPLSWRYHKRAPTMSEVSQHRDSDPQKIRQHYENLPAMNWGYPDITAGDFVKAHTRAQYWSQQHLSRQPYAHEVSLAHHASMTHDDIGAYYSDLRQNRDAQPAQPQTTPQSGREPAAPGTPSTEGQQPSPQPPNI